jgi:DNA-binding HxlR family transcriptional regulator
MNRYGQYCPIAKAAEILTERWSVLILRELIMGSSHYNDIRRGVPLISPSVLAQRLKTLEETGVIECHRGPNGRSSQYGLSAAGIELAPLIRAFGVWGQRWVRSRVREADLDAGLLMWDIRRNIRTEHLPATRTVVHFDLARAKRGMRKWWLVVERGTVDLCLQDPGHEVDLTIAGDLECLTRVWMGDIDLMHACAAGGLVLQGDARLKKSVLQWLGPSPFAAVKAAGQRPAPARHRFGQRGVTGGVQANPPDE